VGREAEDLWSGEMMRLRQSEFLKNWCKKVLDKLEQFYHNVIIETKKKDMRTFQELMILIQIDIQKDFAKGTLDLDQIAKKHGVDIFTVNEAYWILQSRPGGLQALR
jgi:hypothetical protein